MSTFVVFSISIIDYNGKYCLPTPKSGGDKLSLFLLVHTWKKEDFKTVARKVIESVPRLPKGQTMLFSYVDARLTGAWCVYETENTGDLKNFWEKNVPEMHLTEIIPLLQFFPPGADSYKLMHIMASM